MKKLILFCIILVIFLLLGGILGILSSKIINKKFFANQGRLGLIFNTTSRDFIDLYRLLYSSNQYNRVTAYYTLKDLDIVDISFLVKRYKMENALYIKKIIITIIARSEEKKFAIQALVNIFKNADEKIKDFILLKIKELDYMLYLKLLKDKNLKQKAPSGKKIIYQQSFVL